MKAAKLKIHKHFPVLIQIQCFSLTLRFSTIFCVFSLYTFKFFFYPFCLCYSTFIIHYKILAETSLPCVFSVAVAVVDEDDDVDDGGGVVVVAVFQMVKIDIKFSLWHCISFFIAFGWIQRKC